MNFWILAGALTALVTGLVTMPLHKKNRVLALILTFAIPFCALGLYFLLGNPELAK